MSFDDFIAKWNGKGIDWDNYYGFQCFDLAHQYAVDVVGKDVPSAPAAKDLWDTTITGYTKVANTPTGIPQKGDIVIWGTAIGAYGHVAVFVSGNSNSFTSFDQNWPTGSVCHLQNHNYTGVLGWFHPEVTTSLPDLLPDFIYQGRLDVSNPIKQDHFAVFLGFANWQAYQNSLNAPQIALAACQTKYSSLAAADSVISNQYHQSLLTIEDLSQKLATSQKQLDEIATQLHQGGTEGIDLSSGFVMTSLGLLRKFFPASG